MAESSVVAVPGLTMRDWVAMQVLSVLIGRGVSLQNPEEVGAEAYRVADGVLRAREHLLGLEQEVRVAAESTPEAQEARRRAIDMIAGLNAR